MRQKGFTIVELLVVIVVIAILAAIGVVAYTGIQDRVHAATIQTDLSNAKKQLMLYQVAHGAYPTSGATLGAVGLSPTRKVYHTGNVDFANYYYCVNRVTDQFAIMARPVGSTTRGYVVSSGDGIREVPIAQSAACMAAVGLSDTGHPDGYYTAGFSNSTQAWSSWVK